MPTRSSCGKMVAQGQAPTQECLRKAAAHITHDLGLLQLAWEQRDTRLGWTLWFVTARSLSDFFFEPKRKVIDKKKQLVADDILAADYLPPDRWRSIAAQLKNQAPSAYPKIRKAANKLSAHLTYSRVDGPARETAAPSEGVHTFLLGVAAIWFASLSAEHRVWFGRGMA